MRLLSIALAIAACVPASAQIPRGNGQAEPVLADRKVRQRLKDAKEFLEAKEYAAAFRVLQPVLDGGSDAFVAIDNENAAKANIFRSVRAEVDRLIAKQPEDAKRIYEQLYGIAAERALEQAMTGGDLAQLRAVVRRYFHTTTGPIAAYRLGSFLLASGQSSAAAMVLTRLKESSAAKDFEPLLSLRLAIAWRDAGRKEHATKAIAPIAGEKVNVAGKQLLVPAENSFVWLEQLGGPRAILAGTRTWLAFRGGADRNPIIAKLTKADEKVQTWSVPVAIDPLKAPGETVETKHDQRLKEIINRFHGTRGHALPSTIPLVVNDLVLMRTPGNLMCYQLSTGKRLWQSMADPAIEDLLDTPALNNRKGKRRPVPVRRYGLEPFLAQRAFRDVNWGAMSSDGERLFVVEETGSAYQYNIYRPPGNQFHQPPVENLLVAYDLRPGDTFGQRAWEAGGEKGDPLFENPVAGHFFLSAPLAMDGRLYSIADQNGEVKLIAIDPTNGHELWSQPLAVSPWGIRFDAVRRTCGASVAFADGVLVCQTGTGLVVAVNPVSRSLLWAYRLPKIANANPRPRPFPIPNPSNNNALGWADAVPTVAGGRVFLTPRVLGRRGRELCCLDLWTGKLLWSQRDAHAQGDGKLRDLSTEATYLAGVVETTVVIVSRDRVRGFEVATGKVKWTVASGFDAPSGRGVILGSRVLVPSANGELQQIDAKAGKLLPAIKVPGNAALGNLQFHAGRLISQDAQQLRVLETPSIK